MIKLIINPDNLSNTHMLAFPNHQAAIDWALKNLPLYSRFQVLDNNEIVTKGAIGFGLTLHPKVHYEYKQHPTKSNIV